MRATIFKPSLEHATLQQKLAAIPPVASHDWFDWELSEWEQEDQMKTYGFVYKVVADNTSNPAEWLGFDIAFSRNAIAAVFGCWESHLLSGIITFAYPELGLSPSEQAAFIHKFTQHPQAKDVTELRIITRCPYFISDAKSYNVRIIQMDIAPHHEGSVYYRPPLANKRPERLRVLRGDPYFNKGSKRDALFLNYAKSDDDRIAVYLGEDTNFVYWRRSGESGIFRTEHTYMWYDLNAVLISDKVPNMYKDVLDVMRADGWSSDDLRAALMKFSF